MIIKRLQPAYYIAGLCVAWGLVATFSAFVQNLGGLIACRLLLGFFEAGFFPGIILYLTTFYNKGNIALRISYFFATSAVSGAAGGLVAYGIGNMDGTAGWRAWRYILLFNGIPTVLTGLLIPFVLPNSPQTAKFLTDDDRRNMVLLREAETGQTKSAQELHWPDVKAGMLDWKTYAYGLTQFCNNAMLYGFSAFLPTIIRGIGDWSVAEVQLLTIPVYGIGAITYLICSRISDITQIRGPFAAGGQLVATVGYAMLIANHSPGLSFTGCMFVGMGCYVANGTPVAWLSTNNPRYGKRAYASGVQLSMGNSAGVAAPFLFTNAMAPEYRPGYGATIGLLGFAMSTMTTLHLYYRTVNARRERGEEDWKFEGKTEEEVAELGDLSPRFRYTL